MKFSILAVKDGEEKKFFYDNMENILSDESGFVYENPDYKENRYDEYAEEYTVFSPEIPLKKSKTVTTIKIQLGLSCNYSCEYCSQRFVERPEETNFKDIDDFMLKFENLEFDEKKGLRIELWGGEPLVYWKTLKPLVQALKMKFAYWNRKPIYTIITNGSIITDEIVEWLLDNMDGMAISHDGPGQYVRGPDPFDDPEQKERILRLYKTVKSGTRNLKGMTFNSMINAQNQSRKEIREWFVNLTGDKNTMIGEGAFVDAYDDGGVQMSLKTKQDHFDFRQKSFKEIYEIPDGENIGWGQIVTKLNEFMNVVLNHKNAKYLTQKCGMDAEDTMAIDLKGNVFTCQNVSAVSLNSNGKPHLAGNIDSVEDVRVTTSTHWSQRKECSSCPVLHICKGACMFVSGELWEYSCNNAYSDNVTIFALIFEKLTGYIPVYIDGENLPDMRKDIFGTMLEHKEEPKKDFRTGRKPFPVAVVPA